MIRNWFESCSLDCQCCLLVFGPDQNYILCCDIFTIVLPSICFIPTLNRFIPFTLESSLNTYTDFNFMEKKCFVSENQNVNDNIVFERQNQKIYNFRI